MTELAVRDYAFAHARIRGRIGDMPDDAGWQKVINAGDLETTIEAMASSGLLHWVEGFPRNPKPEEIERRCLISLLSISLFVKKSLPGQWKEIGLWLLQLPNVLQIQPLLSADSDKEMLLPGSPFLSIFNSSIAERKAALLESEYAVYLEDGRTPEDCWATQFQSRLPTINGHERRVIIRITQLLAAHQLLLTQALSPDDTWAQRKTLFERLKRQLAGNPFHAGTVLIYGLLESIQYERVRAILLLRAHRWPSMLLRGLS